MAQSNLEVANNALYRLGAKPISSLADNGDVAQVCNARVDICKRAVLRMHPWNFAIERATLDGVAWSSVAANGTEVQVTTAAVHGLSTGDRVTVYGASIASYNGTYDITVDTTTKFTLDDSVYDDTATGYWAEAAEHNEAYKLALPSGCLRILSINEELAFPEGRLEGRYIVSETRPLEIRYIDDVSDYTKMDILFYEALSAYMAHDICHRVVGQNASLRNELMQEFRLLLSKARFVDATEDTTQLLESNDWLESRFGASTLRGMRSISD